MLFVPTGKRGEEEEADERKDNGDDSGMSRQQSVRGNDDTGGTLTSNTETRYYP